ncbi:MAG: hypothetical protein WC270_03235 [Patescibacteria group bacterium]
MPSHASGIGFSVEWFFDPIDYPHVMSKIREFHIIPQGFMVYFNFPHFTGQIALSSKMWGRASFEVVLPESAFARFF